MTRFQLYIDGNPLSIGSLLGKGGEGEVYLLNDGTSRALKVYTRADGQTREQKILAMIKMDLAQQSPLVSFPLAVARKNDGTFAGFVMKLVKNHHPLFELYSPGARKHNFPRADYRFLVRAATNIARAVASVHEGNCVIGDINHSSILVSDTATAALIDADSFQIIDGASRYLSRVGVPEYTPPELHGQNLGTVVRTPNHDAFGLAIVIFQLLFMGRHPFVGTVRKGEIPPIAQAIRDYRFVYDENRDVGMDQPPGTAALSDFPETIAKYFEAAFGRETANHRPTAKQWVAALMDLEKDIVRCKDIELHYFPVTASECPWCFMDRALGMALFVPYIPATETTIHPFDPGAAGFNLIAIWQRIQAVPAPTTQQLTPKLITGRVQPSDEAKNVKKQRIGYRAWGWLVLFGAIGILATAPALWLVWLPLGWWGLTQAFGAPNTDGPFKNKFIDIETKWQEALDDWQRKCGVQELENLQKTLQEAKSSYDGLVTEEKALIAEYKSDRRNRHLHAFLDNYEIRRAKIKGIGPAKEAALASYGIETAADIVKTKVLQVPGFGPSNSKNLLEWRKKLEARFTYDTNPNEVDRLELNAIRTKIEQKASQLRRILLAGPQNLSNVANKIRSVSAAIDPVLNGLHAHHLQIEADLEYLGIPRPATPTRSTRSIPYSASGSQTASPNVSGSPSCPRCGSHMVRRMAHRGRWTGHQFWGCMRYPQCRGTRNI
jgi:DNA-binding helix-hairpin-helix protein with protein kinase domain